MDSFRQFFEMPVTNFQLLGQWSDPKAKRYGYHRDDIGILTNPAGVEKIKRKWSKTEMPFDLYFLRSPQGYKVREVGEVDQEYLRDVLKINIQINPQAITVIFTQNMGAERMPMNYWTIAHRFGHALARKSQAYDYYERELRNEMLRIAQDIYGYGSSRSYGYGYDYGYQDKARRENPDTILKGLAQAIGTMGSARKRLLRNFNEFFHELLAQYIIEGKVRFNPLPNLIPTRYAWGRPEGNWQRVGKEEIESWNEYIQESLTELVNNNLAVALQQSIGKIYVM